MPNNATSDVRGRTRLSTSLRPAPWLEEMCMRVLVAFLATVFAVPTLAVGAEQPIAHRPKCYTRQLLN